MMNVRYRGQCPTRQLLQGTGDNASSRQLLLLLLLSHTVAEGAGHTGSTHPMSCVVHLHVCKTPDTTCDTQCAASILSRKQSLASTAGVLLRGPTLGEAAASTSIVIKQG